MRYKSIEQVKPGEKAGADLFDLLGHVVVAKGIVFTESTLNKLKAQGYSGVYVDDFISSDIELKPVIPQLLRDKANECVQKGDIEAAIDCAKEIVDKVLQSSVISLDMKDLRQYDDYTYVHSVNVAVSCCLVGFALSLSPREMDNLVLAALLHDIGKYRLPIEILNKPGRLTKDEYELIKTHPALSYEIIVDRNDIPREVKSAVLQHHENEDGSGYPLGVSGEHISKITKILHVVDIYDSLIAERPYKKASTPWEAAEYLMGSCGIMFDKEAVDTFIRVVPLYQKGTELVLSTGEHGIVIDNSFENNLRPKLRLFDSYDVIDLSDRRYIATTFYTLKEWELHLQEEKDRPSDTKKTHGKRILIVDDMRMNRILLRGILEANYDLVYAESGKQAIETVAKDRNFDIVLMDIDMPEMNGVTAAAEINRISDMKIPILFVSSVRDMNTVLACKELHAAGYIMRPYKATYILTEIDRIISNSW